MSDSHSPTNELKHFTDRAAEQMRFREVMNTTLPEPLPALNFYGVGGIGKTWLLCRFENIRRDKFPNVPSARIDFDDRKSGARYALNPPDAWFEIVKKLKIPCPRFLLAYAVMLAKQYDRPIEAKELSRAESSKLEVAGELASDLLGQDWVKEVLGEIPLMGLIPFVARKGTEKWAEVRLERSPDFKKLDDMEADQIYDDLIPRLIQDLNAYQPKAPTGQCHSVVFFDTFEALGDITDKIHQANREKWVSDLARGTQRTLVVTLGRNRLWWDERPNETYWNQPQNLEQHRIGNLSEADARLYLERCEITNEALQTEVLRDSYCPPEPNAADPTDAGYHPFTLGLCGDTLWTMREDRGDNTFPLAHQFRFEDGKHGPTAVVERFLEKQGDIRRRWIERLALTLRFDEDAALHAHGNKGDDSEAAWQRLREFSFLSPARDDGWFVLHAHLRNQILEVLPAERKTKEHQKWRAYWQSLI